VHVEAAMGAKPFGDCGCFVSGVVRPQRRR
jgi:hypothetical protein